MPRVRSLQAPMVSIGGAGTFDGGLPHRAGRCPAGVVV